MVADHGDARGNLNDLTYAFDLERAARIEAFYFSIDGRRALDRGLFHARNVHVQAVHGVARSPVNG